MSNHNLILVSDCIKRSEIQCCFYSLSPPVDVWLNLLDWLTCLVDLVAQREAGALVGVVGDKLDEDGGAGGDDGRGGDVAAVLPQQFGCLRVPVVDLDVVIPETQEDND